MMQKVTKAVIAAAGFGTRFLPQTKAMPKEMLPLVDKPIIQYVVEELVDAGVTDIVIVSSQNKRSIEDHFDRPTEDLVTNLKAGGRSKEPLLKMVEDIANLANFIYVRQKGRYGNGTPLMNAEHLIGDEPFFYTWGDDFITASPSRFRQMIDAYDKYGCPVLSTVSAQADSDYDKYGFAGGREIGDGIIDVSEIIEKPGKDNAPSDMATVSGFLLTPAIFSYLHQADASLPDDKELYSNDALKLMLQDGQQMVACKIKNSRYFDAGNKLDYIKANLQFALDDPDVNDDLREYLKSLI